VRNKKLLAIAIALAALIAWMAAQVMAAADAKVRSATREVQAGAQKIGDGKVGDGVEQTAKGVGHTVVEGAKFTGEKLKESGQVAKPPAKSAWAHLKDGSVKESANAFGSSVKSFFTRLFSN
jgi:hypothetical protein